MLGIVGLVGGVLEIRRARKEKQNRAKQEQQLRKAIEQYSAQTEQQRRAAAEAARTAARLEQEGDCLRQEAADSRAAAKGLAVERRRLAADNAKLQRAQQQLSRQAEGLAGEMRELQLVHGRLTDELTAAQAAEAERGAAEMGALRAAAARVLTRLLEGDIDEATAVDELRALGCEVEFVAAPADAATAGAAGGDASSSGGAGPAGAPFEHRLVLDDPARLARLMQAARGGGGSSSGSMGTPVRAALTFGGSASSGGSGAAAGDAARLTLSWREERLVNATSGRAGPAGRASSSDGGSGGGGGGNAMLPDAPSKHSTANAGNNSREVARAGVGGSPAKAAGARPSKAGALAAADDGKLVFSPQPKRPLQQQHRAGVTLIDAAAMFGNGSGGNGGGTLFDNAPSDARAVSDARG